MKDRETPRIHKYGKTKTTRIMMATVRHVTSNSGLGKFQAAWFLLNRRYKVSPLSHILRYSPLSREGTTSSFHTKKTGKLQWFLFMWNLCVFRSGKQNKLFWAERQRTFSKFNVFSEENGEQHQPVHNILHVKTFYLKSLSLSLPKIRRILFASRIQFYIVGFTPVPVAARSKA